MCHLLSLTILYQSKFLIRGRVESSGAALTGSIGSCFAICGRAGAARAQAQAADRAAAWAAPTPTHLPKHQPHHRIPSSYHGHQGCQQCPR